MGCIHSYEVVFPHPDFVVGDFRCAGVSSGPDGDEFTPRHEIAFVRRGIFEKTRGPNVVPADATRVVFFPAGQEYRVRHPLAGAEIHSYEVVFPHPDFVVGDFRCAGVSSGPDGDEFTPRHEIAFVRRGIFEKTRGPNVVPADATRVVFFPAGQEYRVRHPLAGGDECTVLQVSDEVLHHILGEYQPRLADLRPS